MEVCADIQSTFSTVPVETDPNIISMETNTSVTDPTETDPNNTSSSRCRREEISSGLDGQPVVVRRFHVGCGSILVTEEELLVILDINCGSVR